jgi:hypothetical protein
MDHERSLTTLLRLFGDNTTGEITPQDLRDLATSIFPGIGRLETHPDTVTDQSIAERSTAIPIWKASSLPTPIWETLSTDNPGEITIPTTGLYLVLLEVMWSWDHVSTAAQKITLELLKNGQTMPGASASAQLIAVTSEDDRYLSLPVVALLPLYSGDVLTVRLFNPDSKSTSPTPAVSGDCIPKRFLTVRIA